MPLEKTVKYMADGTKIVYEVGSGMVGAFKLFPSALMKLLWALGLKVKW